MNSPGTQIIEQLLETRDRRRFDITLERKASTMLATPANPQPHGIVVPGPNLPLRLRSVIPPGTTTADSVEYPRETSITNSPVVPVAAGAAKPFAGLTYEMVNAPVRTIPAYMRCSDQLWEDFAAFQSWIDARLYYSLAVAEEIQLLNGNGTTPNLQGLMTVAIAAGIAPAGTVNPLLDSLAYGMYLTYTRGYVVDAIVLNPIDWIKTLTHGLSGVIYDAGFPAMLQKPGNRQDAFIWNLWGFMVVLSPGMTPGNYLCGQFNPYCQIFDREDANVEVSLQDRDNFVKNLVTVRAEERLAFAIYQPGAFTKGTFTI